MINKQKISRFHAALHRWYEKEGRKTLPWRTTKDAYAIYLSEVMLQQTQVKTVLERYYFQFLSRFPTLKALAGASKQEVLSAWQGLGYYSRAANLHAAAMQCGGKLPASPDALMALPGIGRNTAHAVCAFAYRQPVAVLEANVKRVVTRIFALETPGDAQLWECAGALLDPKNPFDYNQAMMDIGSMVCTRRAPDCPRCPANNICQGQHNPEAYPAPKQKKTVPVRRKHIVVLRNKKGEYFVTPREGKFLHGLYRFIEIDTPSPIGGGLGWGREDTLASNPDFAPLLASPLQGEVKNLGKIRQQYSHFTLEAEIFLIEKVGEAGKNWHTLSDLKKLPFSMAEQKILTLL